MAITIDWPTKVITIPQADLTFVIGTLYEADTEVIRLALHALSASEEGLPFQRIFEHNTEVTVAGTTFARVIEIINGYSITFTPDTQWSVRLAGSNNNYFDVENGILNQNQVQVIAQNSGGLIVGEGSGVTAQDKLDIADAVWDEAKAGHITAGTYGAEFQTLAADIVSLLGLTGENVSWSNLSHDANNNMTAARITVYDDNTLTTPVLSWDITATYNASSEITGYQMVEV